MENLVSSWSDGRKLPEKYVFPPGKRPGDTVVTKLSKNVPIIDLGKAEGFDRSKIIQQIMQASQEFGFFQVMNHGVPKRLIDDTIVVVNEFLKIPAKEKSKFYTMDLNQKLMVYTSSTQYDKEAIHYWRDVIKHLCSSSLEECMQHWPSNPLRYREVVANYIANQKSLTSKILSLINEGLGLEPEYFKNRGLCVEPNFTVNHYPACLDPSLTWGAGEHCDPGLLTLLYRDNVPGLQLLCDGKWVTIEPNPNSFGIGSPRVENKLYMVVSNGKLRSPKHRVVTNAIKDRTTLVFFNDPRRDCIVRPAQALVSSKNPPVYEPVQFGDLMKAVIARWTEHL